MKTTSAPKYLTWILILASLLILLAAVLEATAQTPSAAIVAAPALKRLPGHRTDAFVKLAPTGDLPASTNLSLEIGLQLSGPDRLEKFLSEMRDPASTNYGRHLTVDQFVERFSPTKDEYQTAIDFAKAHGMTVTATYKNRLLFNVTGSAADVEKLFHVRLKLYSHPKEHRHFFAPDREPSIDPRFPILDVTGLNNYGSPHRLGAKPESYATNSIESYNISGSGPNGLLVGNDFRNAYVPGVPLKGYGQYIGLFQFNSYYPQDITYYAKIAGFGTMNVTNISVNGFDTSAPTTLGVIDFEQTGDIEMALSMAPAATILVYEGRGGEMASIFHQMASDGLAKQISCSWGEGTADGKPGPLVINAINELNAQGQVVFIASGDAGAYGDGTTPLSNPGGFTNVTICGGTVLRLASSGGTYQSEVVWSGSGGGPHPNFDLPYYQQGMDVTAIHGSTSLRNVPDVAAASIGMLITGGGTNAYFIGAGTSFAAPLWAGFMALVNEQRADHGLPSLANLNDALYALGKGPNYANAFHDITVGNNTNTVTPANYFAATGYDLCTGWGTPNGTNLINLLAPALPGMQITPNFGFAATAQFNGSIPAASTTFKIFDTGPAVVAWAASGVPPWLHLSATSGALLGGQSANVTASLVPSAVSGLPVGTYYAQVAFADAIGGRAEYRHFSLTVSAAAQPLALTGFNASLIVPTNATLAQPRAVAFDQSFNYSLYQAGFPGATRGVPAGGQFVSGWDGQTVFQLGPFDGSNHALLLGHSNPASGALTFVTPQQLNLLVILASSANGATASSVGTVVLNFTDGTHSPALKFGAPHWFNSGINAALGGFGRISTTSLSTEEYGDTVPSLFQTTLPLAQMGLTQAIASLTFTMPVEATNTAIFAVSGVGGPLSGLLPTITRQPQPATNLYSSNAVSIAVGVAGPPPFSYQWRSNGIPLPDSDAPTLTFDPGTPANNTAMYLVVVSNQFGSVTSSGAVVTFYRSPPSITQQPAPLNLFVGANGSLTGVASSLIPVSYAWNFNGAPIPGATNATLTINHLQPSNAGIYALVANNAYGAVTSAPVSVTATGLGGPYPSAVLALSPLSYWRLDETSGGMAFDYAGGQNGIYNNVTLGQPGYGTASGVGTDPSELAAQFGPVNAQSYVSLPNLDLSVPNGGNGEFAIAAWVRAGNSITSDAGIFTKGYGAGDEQFNLDCGGPGHAFRFFVRNAQSAAASLATSTVTPDNQWHFLVGVCDQINSTVALYVDGTNAAQGALLPGTGIHATSLPAGIGARKSGSVTPYDLQFVGFIDDVAVFTNAFSSAQVLSLYNSGKFGPVITQHPQSPWTGAVGEAATNQVTATGQSLTYQWYGPSGALVGATNPAITLASLSLSQRGNYYVIVSNLYGTAQSLNAFLNVAATNAPYWGAALALNPIGYWRMNETSGTIAHDSAGTNDGAYYNAILGQPGYDSTATFQTDPFELGAVFGVSTNQDSYMAIPNIDLSQPFRSNGRFSISTWIRATNGIAESAGIISKGGGGGDEEFCLDFGSSYGVGLRFFVRDADVFTRAWTVDSRFYPDNKWHFVVAVCDQANSLLSLYVDGLNIANDMVESLDGIHATSLPVAIGSRTSGTSTPHDFQFHGTISDTAIFTNALTSAQIFALYNAAMPAPAIVQQPLPLMRTVPGGSVTNSVFSSGTNLAYQWFGPSGAIARATNAALILTNVQPASGGGYYVTISNQYGFAQSSNSTLTLVPPLTAPYPRAVMALNPIAYWRFNETNGNVAIDYAGYNHGLYNNAILGQPGYDSMAAFPTEPAELSAGFAATNGANSYVTVPGSTIDFTQKDSRNYKAFSFAGWVNPSLSVENGGGIIAKGPKNAEEFCLDTGGPNNGFRFFYRDYVNDLPCEAASSAAPDGKWHFVAAVCQISLGNSYVALYVDGILVAQTAASQFAYGIGDFVNDYTAIPVLIGARQSSLNGTPDTQFTGNIGDLAVFPFLLGSNQVLTLFEKGNPLFNPAALPATQITLSTAQLNGMANPSTFPSTAWFQWGTSTGYGHTAPAQNLGNGLTNVSLAAPIVGLTTGVGYHYRVVISNEFGIFPGPDALFTTIVNPVVFIDSAWSSNQVGAFTTPTIGNGVLRLTDGAGSEARSVFFPVPQYIGAFKASFTYWDVVGGGADGAAFVLQNDPRGPAALGGIGGSLGYGAPNAITPSAALELNIYGGNGANVGYTFLTNGLTGGGGANGGYLITDGLFLAGSQPIHITMDYTSGRLALTFSNVVNGISFATNSNVGDLSKVVGGSTAYVGFTGADGAFASTQIITDFSFVSIPKANITLTAGNALISWPAAIPGYAVQTSTNLASGNWITLTNQPVIVNSENRVVLTMPNVNTFYRLVLP